MPEQLVRPADGIEQTHLSGDNAAVHPGDGLQPALGGGLPSGLRGRPKPSIAPQLTSDSTIRTFPRLPVRSRKSS